MPFSSIDASLFKVLNSGLNVPAFNPLMVFITNQNYFVFLALFILSFLYERKGALVVLLLALASFGVADWTGSQLKDLIARPRPCQSLDEIILLVKCTGLSMPSNHAGNSFAFATPFILMRKGQVRWIILGFAALVAYSRVYVGVHYPGDILVGSLLGSAVGFGVSFIFLRFKGNKRHEDIVTDHDDNQKSTP